MNNDEVTLKEKKLLIQQRISKAIVGLRRHWRADRTATAALDRIAILVNPGMAYGRGKDALSFLPDIHRERARTPKKVVIVLHEIAHLLFRYWELTRQDETTELDIRLRHLEGWAKYGLKDCQILGGPNIGYSLFNAAAQKEGG